MPREYQPRQAFPGPENINITLNAELDVFEERFIDPLNEKEVQTYIDILISVSSPKGEYTTATRGAFEVVMGDKYTVNQAGIVGPGATGNTVNVVQTWNEIKEQVDLKALAKELGQMRAALAIQPESLERDEAIGQVAGAERDALDGNGPAVLRRLASAGKALLGIATKIGAAVAEKAIEAAIGL